MSLTKEERDALPDSDFAVPESRDLPMHDKTHTKMAWSVVDKTKGLSVQQRQSAKENILLRAEEQGINVNEWNLTLLDTARTKITIHFNAMAIEMPEVNDHPNKVPFNGILTRIDEPSDAPVGGANGRRIIIPKAVAEKALDSLACMAVDFKPDFDGHDARRKIGIITEANIVGNAIEIKGFFYGADFPLEVKRIQAEKNLLGFSYEAQAQVRSMDDDPWVINNCIFTGAAVLYRDLAAYQSTSLAASAESEEMSKTNEDILSLLNDIKKDNVELKKELAEIKANADKKEEASKLSASDLSKLVAPHAQAVRACAANMAAAGIGTSPGNGHAAVLNKMADRMQAAAASGVMPHVYQTDDFLSASKVQEKEEDKKEDPEISKIKNDLAASLATVQTHIEDLKKEKFEAAKEPERRTVTVAANKLLQKIGIQAGDDQKIELSALDKALDVAKMDVSQRIRFKTAAKEQGLISN